MGVRQQAAGSRQQAAGSILGLISHIFINSHIGSKSHISI